jgi:uridylate kinase
VLGCGFTRKNFRNRIQWGLDSDECLTEIYEHRNMEDAIGIQVQVLNTVVLEKTLEEITGREG